MLSLENGRNKCSASLTIDSITGEIKKVNGEKWNKVTPLRDFHDHDPEDENEVKKLFILRDINNKASSNSGPIPQMFEAKNSELADEGYTVDEGYNHQFIVDMPKIFLLFHNRSMNFIFMTMIKN